MIQVRIKIKASILNLVFNENDLVVEIKKQIWESQKMPIAQQRLEVESEDKVKVVLKNDAKVSSLLPYAKEDVITLICKDLGSQIAYNALFYIEYCFPPLSTLACYLANWKRNNKYHTLLTLAILFHFGKRLLETKFVHIFSNPSVPFRVLIRNCIHYWVLIGGLMPVEVFWLRKMNFPAKLNKTKMTALVLFVLFELLNFLCHLKLRNMRTKTQPNGTVAITMDRSIPKGLFFNTIISPNYTFEVLAWASFSVLFNSWVASGFTLVSAGIMTQWSAQKKKRLLELKETSEEDKRRIKRRWLILPYVL